MINSVSYDSNNCVFYDINNYVVGYYKPNSDPFFWDNWE